jgi:hypothetical protein
MPVGDHPHRAKVPLVHVPGFVWVVSLQLFGRGKERRDSGRRTRSATNWPRRAKHCGAQRVSCLVCSDRKSAEPPREGTPR